MYETDLDKLILTDMPHFIAINYQRLLTAQTPQECVDLALHIYNLGLRALTIGLVSQYLIRDKDRVIDPYLNELLLKKFPNLTLDGWQQILFTSLKVYEGNRDLFFIPELYDFYWDTSILPNRRRAEVEDPFNRLTQLAIERQVKHLSPQNEDEWEHLATETLNLLQQILHHCAFISQYDLIRVLNYDEKFYDFELHKGITISLDHQPLPRQVQFGRGWFYLRKEMAEFLLLHPLLIFWEDELEKSKSTLTDTGVYDRFIYKSLKYLPATLGKESIVDKSITAFVTLLYETIEEVKQKHQKVDQLTWWKLRDICAEITHKRMSTVRGKYQSDLYLQRDKTCQAFEKFLASDKRCFVLIGKSGVGKSNFLLALEELQQLHSDLCFLMYDGAQLKVEPSITEIISKDFNSRLKGVQQIWSVLEQVEGIEDRQVILCVDAINENPQAKELLRQLDELVQSPWPWLKIVCSSRPETWRAIKRGVKLAEALYYREEDSEILGVKLESFSYSDQMEPFSRQELPIVYAKYQQMFQLKTQYESLPSELREMLRDPLNLWLVSKTYTGKAIPNELKRTKLISEYVSALLEGRRLHNVDLHLLEQKLVPLMVREGHYSNTVTIPELDSAGDGLHEAIYSEQMLSDGQLRNQSFVNLLDTDILTTQTESIDTGPKIAFKYERFYEYFVGKRLTQLSNNLQGDHLSFFRDMISKTTEVPFLWGAVRSALVQDLKDNGFETTLTLCFTDQQRVKEIMISVLIEFGQDNQSQIVAFLENLIIVQGQSYLRRFAEDETRNNAKRIAMEVASRLGIVSVLVIAADDPSPAIRTVATRQIYYLWHRDREKGFAVLRKITKNVRNRWGLPNSRILETYFGVSFLIFFQDLENREIVETLRLITKDIIKQLLYVDNKLKFAQPLIRSWLLKLIIRFATNFAKVSRYNVITPVELGAFFELPNEERQRLEKFLPYLSGKRTDIENIKEEILAAAKTGDLLITYAIYHLLIAQGILNWQMVKSLVKEAFDIGMSHTTQNHIPLVTVPQMLNVPAGICMIQEIADEDMISFYQELTKKFYDTSKGGFHCKYGTYFGTYLSTSAFFLRKYGDIEESLWVRYALKAIEERDEAYLLDLIWDLGNLALGFEQPNLALHAARFLLPVNMSSVQSAFLNFLAQVRIRYPDHVDDFFAENEVSSETVEKVKSIEVVEEFSSIIHLPFVRFFAGVSSSPTWNVHDVDVFERALRCDSINQWLEFIAKKIINGVYGETIFLGD